jgi:transposase
VAWLACHTALTVLAVLRITWRSVAAVITRVVAQRSAQTDRLTGLRRIGVDEISYPKGHRYLLCVVDHDTGRLCWYAPTPRVPRTPSLIISPRRGWSSPSEPACTTTGSG